MDYFTNSLSKDDYFFSGDSIDGRWHGQLKNELGLPDTVSQKSFSKLAKGLHPKTDQPLFQRHIKNRRTSIEYTFASPKSVSIVMALSDERTGKDILNAHRRAVKKAMLEIEQDMQTQTTIAGKKQYAGTGNIVYARFDHFTARPVKDNELDDSPYISDPHLHSHCVVMNVTRHHEKYQALEGSTIHRVAEYYEAVYHSHLSKSLNDLGFNIRRTETRWEIDSPGLTRKTIEKFSRRTMEIESLAHEIAQKRGGISQKAKSELGAKIRVNKSKVKTNVDLVEMWQKRLTMREASAIAQAKNLPLQKRPQSSPAMNVDRAMTHHFERQSALPVKKLLARAMALGYGRVSPQHTKTALDKRDDVLYAPKGYLEHMTTRGMVAAEDQMISYAARGKGTCAPIHPTYKIERGFLNKAQTKAIKDILSSQDRVQILSGAAGVGKSTLLAEIKTAAAQKGQSVMAFAPSSGASRDVLRSKGFKQADTIAAFLRKKELQDQARRQIILIDEASLVGVKTMNKIFETSRKLNARVILSGDPRQHSSPEAGDANRILIEKAGLKVAQVDTILRQKSNPKLKAAIEDLSRGQARTAYAKLEKMNAITEIEDVKARYETMAKDYVQALEQGKSALAISPTHIEGQAITQAIREEMKNCGRISAIERQYKIHRNLPYTAAQKKDIAMYEDGMVIQFHQNAVGGFKAGQRYEVASLDRKTGQVLVRADHQNTPVKLPLNACNRFDVSKPDNIALARGDLIRINRNGRTMDNKRLYNGQVFKVEGFSTKGDIHLNGGRIIDRHFGNFTYGLVQTSHAAQGKDAQAVFIAQGSISLPATNTKQLYVSASRAREDLKIYTDDRQALKEAICRNGERMHAHEIATHKDRSRTRRRTYYLKTIKEKIKAYGARKRPAKTPIFGSRTARPPRIDISRE